MGYFVGWNVLLCFDHFFPKSIWFQFFQFFQTVSLFELGAWILSNLIKSCLPSCAFLHKIIRHFDINFWLLSPKIPLCTYEVCMNVIQWVKTIYWLAFIIQNVYFKHFKNCFANLWIFQKTEIKEIFLCNCKCTKFRKYFVKI